MNFKERFYKKIIEKNKVCYLGADIGGTNSNFGIFTVKNDTLTLLFSLHFKSQKIISFTDIVNKVLQYAKEKYNITIKKSCFAAAGIVSENHDYCKPTNLNFALSSEEILQKTNLTCAKIVNDFEVIGHGINEIDKSNLVLINKNKKARKKSSQAIIGAGTGLGKCIMHWHSSINRHLPVPSEGGHADFAAHTKIEFDLIQFIQKLEHFSCPVSWEDILSGNGIQRIYKFFKQKLSILNNANLHPDQIFNVRHQDQAAFETFKLYTKLYARCAKNFALDALALGGVYIAGGIASKNLQIFEQKEFLQEFTCCGKQQEALQKIPIYVITDYNISLYGAAAYMLLEGLCI